MTLAPDPLPYKQLVDLGNNGPALALPFETRQSYPLPVRRPSGLAVVFVYCPQGRAGKGLHLIAPTHVAEMSATTGKLESLKRLAPESLEPGHSPGQDIGAHKMPPGLDYDSYKAAEQHMFEALDVVLPLFAAGTESVPPEAKAAAAEAQTLFLRLSEAPLAPYYHSIGKDFFTWLSAAAA